MSAESPKTLLDPKKSLLLVIDLQEKFAPFLKRPKRVLYGTKLLLSVAKQLGVPVVVTEHNPKRIGATVPELTSHIAKLELSCPVIAKDIFSCFGEPAVAAAIAEHKGVEEIVIVGCETHICVLQTTFEALRAGYRVTVVADAVDSRKEIDYDNGLARIRTFGATVGTSEMVAYEFLRRSDTPDFKALLPAFKEWTTREED